MVVYAHNRHTNSTNMALPKPTTALQETAILVALVTPQQPRATIQEHLSELRLLALTLDIQVIHTFTQYLVRPHVKTLVGKGKLADIADFVKARAVNMVIFDDELSPSQVRNLENILLCKVIDRNLLILNTFAMRAKTVQAKTQVELAQYQYLLPRLTGMWHHLSRQKGGSTGMRGPGEKELETDRRIVRQKITHLRTHLKAIERQSVTQRKTRTQFVNVALVGYTNVGKSTLMRVLSKANVCAENKLFATVGATVRKVVMDNIPFLLTDTVGFIRKLPHTLIECFKATLDEIRNADILLHVVDISHTSYLDHIKVVQATLQEIGVRNTPTIMVLNKADQVNDTTFIKNYITNLTGTHGVPPAVLISATQRLNTKTLKNVLYQYVLAQHQQAYPNYLNNTAS